MMGSYFTKNWLVARLRDESGAITIDWVVLTAAVAGLVTAIFFSLGNDTADYSQLIGDAMSAQGIKTEY